MDTKKLLEDISENCLSQLTKYKYNKGLNVSEKYRNGKITSYQYVLDLTYHFFQKDKQLKIEFENHIDSQIDKISSLKSGDYQRGIIEVLNQIKHQLKEEEKQ